MKHTAEDLKMMQALPLEMKIQLTKDRIRSWVNTYGESGVYVSFSGGKDSTVLKHIVDQMYDDVPALFVNTGLEFPEIVQFVKDVQKGKYEVLNPNVDIVRPDINFREVIIKHGYPMISKDISKVVHYARYGEEGRYKTQCLERLDGVRLSPSGQLSQYNCKKWKKMLDADFDISPKCCDAMKKKPANEYAKKTGRKQIVGTMAEESRIRKQGWMKTGCNAYDSRKPSSQPMAFWLEQDVLHYIRQYNVPYASIYGDIVSCDSDGMQYGSELFDGTVLKTTGQRRTGCIFCGFGVRQDGTPNRFQRLKEIHPKLWDYCINGGEYGEDGMWRPSRTGLGMGKVLDYIGVPYE